MKTLDRSKKIKDRLIECSQNGELMYTDELHILQYLLERYNPMSLSDYARKEGISPNGAKDRIKRGKVMQLNIIGRTFIF